MEGSSLGDFQNPSQFQQISPSTAAQSPSIATNLPPRSSLILPKPPSHLQKSNPATDLSPLFIPDPRVWEVSKRRSIQRDTRPPQHSSGGLARPPTIPISTAPLDLHPHGNSSEASPCNVDQTHSLTSSVAPSLPGEPLLHTDPATLHGSIAQAPLLSRPHALSGNQIQSTTTAHQVFAVLPQQARLATNPSSLIAQVQSTLVDGHVTPVNVSNQHTNEHTPSLDGLAKQTAATQQTGRSAHHVFDCMGQSIRASTKEGPASQATPLHQVNISTSVGTVAQPASQVSAAPIAGLQSGQQVLQATDSAVPCLPAFPPLILTPHLTIPQTQLHSGIPNTGNIHPTPLQQSVHQGNTTVHSQLPTNNPRPKPSYAAVVRPASQQQQKQKPSNIPPLLPYIPLAYQPPVIVNGKPLVSFSDEEMDKAEALFINSIVLKFSRGNPALAKIREAIALWELSMPYSVGIMDSRHVLVRMTCREDLLRALSIDCFKIDSRLFRSFRWTPNFTTKTEPSLASVWVSFSELPFTLFGPSFVERIASSLGTLLRMDVPTSNTSRLRIARACVEVDLAAPLLHEVSISVRGKVFDQPIEYVSNTAYCTGCHLHGHTSSLCRKNRSRKEATTQPPVHSHPLSPRRKSRTLQEPNTQPPIQPTATAHTTPPPPPNNVPQNTHIHIASPQSNPPISHFPNLSPLSTPVPIHSPTAVPVDGAFTDCSDSPSPTSRPISAQVRGKAIAVPEAHVEDHAANVVHSSESESEGSEASNGGYEDGWFDPCPLSDQQFQTVRRRQRYAKKKPASAVECHGNRVKERLSSQVQHDRQGSKAKQRSDLRIAR